jgi:hypothetical protein
MHSPKIRDQLLIDADVEFLPLDECAVCEPTCAGEATHRLLVLTREDHNLHALLDGLDLVDNPRRDLTCQCQCSQEAKIRNWDVIPIQCRMELMVFRVLLAEHYLLVGETNNSLTLTTYAHQVS